MGSRTSKKRTCIELFAGAGGLALGMEEAGWDGLFALEKDPMAFETLERNMLADGAPLAAFKKWPDWLPKAPHDIQRCLSYRAVRQELRALRGSVGVVAGGPPCQGFSVGGARNGQDSRNELVHSMLQLVDLVEPDMVLVENVEGFARRFRSKPREHAVSMAEHVVERLSSSGYQSLISVLDASRFGVPQRRRRVFIVAMRNELGPFDLRSAYRAALASARIGQLSGLGLPLDRSVTVRDAIHDLDGPEKVPCPDSPKFESGTYRAATSAYAELMRGAAPIGAVPQSHRFSHHGERITALYARAHATQPPGRLDRRFLRMNGTKKDKKVLLDPNAPSSTITTHPDEFIHYAQPRNVTVREMARLQSFPDVFHFHGRYTINGDRRKFDVARCCQVGNAVPPLLARAVGAALLNMLEWAEEGTIPQVDAPAPVEIIQ